MKVFEVLKKPEPKEDENKPALLTRQAGPVLSKYEKKVIKNKLKRGHVPAFIKKQAE
jgi:hypothetical protein